MTPEEKQALKRKFRGQQVAAERAAAPFSVEAGEEFFDALDQKLSSEPCDHSMRMTRTILAEMGRLADPVIAWLCEHGGYCDCEVLANVEPFWESLVESRL